MPTFPDPDLVMRSDVLTVIELRDYFAIKVMQSLVVQLTLNDRKRYREGGGGGGHEAEVAYAIADAMLAQRVK